MTNDLKQKIPSQKRKIGTKKLDGNRSVQKEPEKETCHPIFLYYIFFPYLDFGHDIIG